MRYVLGIDSAANSNRFCPDIDPAPAGSLISAAESDAEIF
jgi:hypothetical protein